MNVEAVSKNDYKYTESVNNGTDKIVKFGWEMRDEPGEFRMIDKRVLQIDPAYQRALKESRTNEIASSWSWLSCGALIVAERNNLFYVIDGQHRLMAARKRSDITHLPCLIFKAPGLPKEADSFVTANTKRGVVTALDMHKARIVAGDEVSLFVDGWLRQRGQVISNDSKPGVVQCVGVAVAIAKQNPEAFTSVFEIAIRLCGSEQQIQKILVAGLHYIYTNIEGGFYDRRFTARIESVGATGLTDAAIRAAAYYARGGAKVWAHGMLNEINRGLRNKFSFKKNKSMDESPEEEDQE